MAELDFPCIMCGASEEPHMPGCSVAEQSVAEQGSENEEEQENGETGDVDAFPESTAAASSIPSPEPMPEPTTNGLNINKDPTTLSSEELVWTVNTIRKKVLDNIPVSDAEIAYSIKCIAIMRSHRPQAATKGVAKAPVKQMGLDDF